MEGLETLLRVLAEVGVVAFGVYVGIYLVARSGFLAFTDVQVGDEGGSGEGGEDE